VTKAFRVGKPVQDKPRLLIVGLENVEVKIDVLKLAPQLRTTEEWKDVFITPDLTWKEREEGRKLREELRRRTSEGEHNLMIQRGRIVKRGGNEVQGQQTPNQQQREQDDTHQPAQQDEAPEPVADGIMVNP